MLTAFSRANVLERMICCSTRDSEEPITPVKSNDVDDGFVKKDKSYVIVGSATHLWVKTVNWLLQQDAKKLIFVIGGNTSVMRRSQRAVYSLIQKYCDVSFILTSAERLNTVKEAETLLREFTTYSRIEAVFCVEQVRCVRTPGPMCTRINVFDLFHVCRTTRG